ncbi:hypothetical protein JCM19538_874 [Jejuia pallidilutea]|uniref:Secretion system C-terminal sorting domain-containing protein n=1 Tax=Jejuia pallidilutea TaxID=504487 RepID=A0A098LV88_9FLAO|nr:hypothetical protein JCM19538_874 [Jejuia pallidilutea]
MVYDGRTDSANFLDLGVVELGATTGVDVLNLVASAGICASLDAAGAAIMVESCTADAGTLTAYADTVTLTGDSVTISATADGNINIPDGYSKQFVLTSGEDLVIEAVGAEPSFAVAAAGRYTIHTLVYDGRADSANFLDLGVVEFGATTGVDVLNLVASAGICASLDAAGAPIMVEENEVVCDASSGKMYSQKPVQCLSRGEATIAAKFYQQPHIPEGYQQLYVLTEAYSLTILQVSASPEFTVSHQGFYRIHSLVYSPETLDLSVVQFGKTTGFDVLNLIEANNICASLHVRGAINLVIGSKWFCYFFNKYRAHHWNKKSGKGPNDDDLAGYIDTYSSYDEFEASFINQNDEVRFYPNPVVDNLNVEIRLFDNEEMDYNVMDVRGRMIMSGSAEALKSGKFTLNTNQFAKGMYIVNFVSEFRTVTKKIIIEK